MRLETVFAAVMQHLSGLTEICSHVQGWKVTKAKQVKSGKCSVSVYIFYFNNISTAHYVYNVQIDKYLRFTACCLGPQGLQFWVHV